MPETVDLFDVPIWSVGTYNGDKYTEDHLDQMAQAYADLEGVHDVPLVAGHSAEQRLVQKDGWPAWGWIKNVRRNGAKLLADITDVPKKVAELIDLGAYRKISPEILWNYKHGTGKDATTYERMLWRVSLLGADIPANSAVGFTGLYSQPKSGLLKVYDLQDEQNPKTDTKMEEQELKARIAQLEAEKAEAKAYANKQESEHKSAMDRVSELEAAAETQKAETYANRLAAVVDKHTAGEDKSGKILPKQAPFLYALILGDTEKEGLKTYSREGMEPVSYSDRVELLENFLGSMDDLHMEALTTHKDGSDLKKHRNEAPAEKLDRYADEIAKENPDMDPRKVYSLAALRAEGEK